MGKPYVFIAGANGSIGSDFCRLLEVSGFCFTRLKRDEDGYNIDYNSDLSDHDCCLIYLGSLTPANNGSHPFGYHLNSRFLQECVSTLSRYYNLKKIYFASSVSVYDKTNCGPVLSEDSRLTTSDPYGISKLRCEEFLAGFITSHPEITYIAMRLPGVLATGSAKRSHNFLSRLIVSLRSGEDVSLIHEKSLFNNIISSTHIFRIFERTSVDDLELPNMPVNLASFPPCPLGMVVEELYRLVGGKSIVSWVDGDAPAFTIDTSRAKGLGLSLPSVSSSIQEGLCLEI
jgi:nucleoside-diphosphate-sugar epimerase